MFEKYIVYTSKEGFMKKGAKYLLSILVYSIILYTIAIIISNIINCEIKNILFIEGIIIVMIGN